MKDKAYELLGRRVGEIMSKKRLRSDADKGMRYAVCGMNDKNNSIPRNGTPLFFPEDPENGFTSGPAGLSRRKFLKRSGGATAATTLSWITLQNEALAAVSHEGQNSEGSWQIKAKKFGKSTFTVTNGTPPNDYATPVVSLPGIDQPPNLPNPFNHVYNGVTYSIKLMYSLYIAHDDSQTDSSKTFKATATNVGLVCFRGEVYYLHTGSGIYKKAGLALSSSVLSSPAFTETQVSMTKNIDSDGLVTTPSRSENFRADDNSLFVSWLKTTMMS